MLKSSISLFVVTILLGVSGAAQKVLNDPDAEVRTATGYHSVSVSSGIDLYLTQGDEETVVISAEDKIKERIKTEVTNGVLKIYIEWKSNIKISWNNKKPSKAYVSYKSLKSISGSGGSDIRLVDGIIKTDELHISLSGGSDFNGSVDVSKLNINQSGGSDSDIRGSAGRMEADISGGCDIDAYGLAVENCVINASGGSDARINVSAKLVANASGGSDIDVKGKCEITKNTSGASEIRRRD